MNWLIGHLVGDYLFQNDWMAANKKKNSFPCFVHALVYTGTIWLFTFWPWYALVFTGLTHFAIDRTMFVKHFCKFLHREKFVSPTNEYPCATGPGQPNPFWPWSWVAVDNTMHLALLYFTDMAVKAFA